MTKKISVFSNIVLIFLIAALGILPLSGALGISNADINGPGTYPKSIIVGYSDGTVTTVGVPDGAAGELVKEDYAARDDVAYVEDDQTARVTAAEPNDPFYGVLQKKPFGAMSVTDAWDITGGSETVVVAVLDTGVDLSHPDLDGKIAPDGYDFVNDKGSAADDNGHGTMIAGIIAATANNDEGIAGATQNCLILPVKVLDAKGSGNVSDIASGIIYAADHGAGVINLSLTYPSYSRTLQDAIDYAYGKGILVVAASGNDGGKVLYPAASEHAVAVGAVTASSELADYSNYGDGLTFVAVGSRIFSTAMGGGYAVSSGTSYAVPFVSSLAALLLSVNEKYTPDQLIDVMRETATDLGDKGWDKYYGYGCVNFSAAVGTAQEELSSNEAGDLSLLNAHHIQSGEQI